MKSQKRLDRIRHYFYKYAEDVEESLNFLEWLQVKSPKFGKPTIIWTNEVFRIVYGTYHPLSVMGSLAKGGRFNIGGAQLNQFFPNLSMYACLYVASTIECARKEAGDLLGDAQEYLLIPKKALQLWDLEEILKVTLDYPNLKKIVDSTPLSAVWPLQKVPKVSQIISYHLKKAGGDGLIYPSTKDSKNKIIAFFAKDDNDVMESFNFKKLKQKNK